MLDTKKLVPYMMIEFVGILLAAYFILCGNSPELIQDLHLPVLFQGDMNYPMAVLAFAAFATPLIMYIVRNARPGKR